MADIIGWIGIPKCNNRCTCLASLGISANIPITATKCYLQNLIIELSLDYSACV